MISIKRFLTIYYLFDQFKIVHQKKILLSNLFLWFLMMSHHNEPCHDQFVYLFLINGIITEHLRHWCQKCIRIIFYGRPIFLRYLFDLCFYIDTSSPAIKSLYFYYLTHTFIPQVCLYRSVDGLSFTTNLSSI